MDARVAGRDLDCRLVPVLDFEQIKKRTVDAFDIVGLRDCCHGPQSLARILSRAVSKPYHVDASPT